MERLALCIACLLGLWLVSSLPHDRCSARTSHPSLTRTKCRIGSITPLFLSYNAEAALYASSTPTGGAAPGFSGNKHNHQNHGDIRATLLSLNNDLRYPSKRVKVGSNMRNSIVHHTTTLTGL
jgi:hypothetical protein